MYKIDTTKKYICKEASSDSLNPYKGKPVTYLHESLYLPFF